MAGESSTNRTKLAYIKEDTYGVVKTGSNLQVLRPTGESLKQDTSFVVSAEIRSDRQTANVVRTGVSAAGAINGELSHDTWDDFLLWSLQGSAWSAPVSVGPLNTISFALADNSVSDSANGLAGFTANQWVYISGAATPANNGFAKIVSVAAGKLVLKGKIVANEIAGANITINQGKYAENGTTLCTANIERIYEDLTTTIARFTGMGINSWSLNIPVDGIINTSFAFMGKLQDHITVSGGSGYTAATTTKPMTTVNDLSTLLENYAASGFLTAGITLNNNLRARQEAGTFGTTGLGVGKCTIEGTIEMYFRTVAEMDKYLDQTGTSLVWILRNVIGESYVVEVPAVRFMDGENAAGSENQDVIAKIKWNGFMDPTEGKTIRIASFG